MAKAKKTDLAELESIGEGLPSHSTQTGVGKSPDLVKPSHDAPDHVWAEYVQATQPDLALPKYFEAFIRNKKGEKGWESQTKVGAQKSINASQQTVFVQFKRISSAIAEAKTAKAESVEQSLTAARVAEILRRGRAVQLDPYSLFLGHPDLKYFQRRRIRLQHDLDELAESVGLWNVLEMITVQAASAENGRIQRIIDGFGRNEAWILANEKAGGTAEKPVLEYPIYFVVECTNHEAALIQLEKNRHKENYDDADRDYSIVLMNEQDGYSPTQLAQIQGLDRKRVYQILSAWQDVPPELRTHLEQRKATTKHGEQIARLKKWPKEQKRVTDWLLEQVKTTQWKDAHLEPKYGYDSKLTATEYNESGVSAGQLGMMVHSALEKYQNAEKAAAKIEELKKEGAVSDKIDEEKAEKLRSKVAKAIGKSEISKTSMQMALHEAGVKIEKPKSDEYTEGPKRPASPANYREREKPKPIPPCEACSLNYSRGTLDRKVHCEWGLTPDADNKCPVQPAFMGRPTQRLHKCSVCGGSTVEYLLKANGFQTRITHIDNEPTLDHQVCLIDEQMAAGALTGKCATCQHGECQIVRLLRNGAPLRLDVRECAQSEFWFQQRPSITVAEMNAKAQAEIDGLKERIFANTYTAARSVEQIKAEFPAEIVEEESTFTLSGTFESEEEADRFVDEHSGTHVDRIDIRGGFGEPKLWGVYLSPFEDEGDEEENA